MTGQLDDAVPRAPDPGSDQAIAAGCRCDPLANKALPPGAWLITAGCPIHHPHRQENVA